ncbi:MULTISPECIES: rod shape-determining protein MreD [unclassified Thalassotalea]|uniref:rod shape-determining protein MreD n=1 Tax=unclassified Thalassotalea TaxID=2614972 RepID=UPI0010816212|nr:MULTISPECIES: rod shape-determining protein MreD [unclassified Thalassotalea]NMP15709.1 rod shape-determining protein MreD [Thalassotalea sp. Y01]QBY04766.1 rod shape-determining protein MreD [Thalassotalea sp. HSM 43]
MKAKNNNIVIVITLVVSLILTIIPMPLGADSFRPNWTLMVLVYWSLALPNRVNVLYGWFVGFIIDVLLGSVLGVNAFASALVVYVSANNYQKIRNFSLWQQSLIIGLFVALYHLIVFWIQRFLFDVDFAISYLKPVLTSSALWFVVFLLLRKVRRHFRVH